jgi:iron complex outermembrane receptor protein
MNASGSLQDTVGRNLFVKLGYNFGANREQRIEGLGQQVQPERQGQLHLPGRQPRQFGSPTPRSRASRSARPASSTTSASTRLNYKQRRPLGRLVVGTGLLRHQKMRFVAEKGGADKQDPLIAPLGTLVDQSEVRSRRTACAMATAVRRLPA